MYLTLYQAHTNHIIFSSIYYSTRCQTSPAPKATQINNFLSSTIYNIIFSAICKVYVYVINKLYICDNWQYVTGPKAESIEWFCGRMIWLIPTFHPLPPSRPQVVSRSQSSCVSPVELSDMDMRVGGFPYDGEKAWTSINYSILSCQKSTPPPPNLGLPLPGVPILTRRNILGSPLPCCCKGPQK